MHKVFVVTGSDVGKRLDTFLSKKLASVSRTKIHKLIEDKSVLVNQTAKKPSYRLKVNEKISLQIVAAGREALKPFKLNIKVIYEDGDIIIVDKPKNLVVHPPRIDTDEALVNALLYMKKELSSINNARPGVVHRLDKETSGVMVLAKTNSAHLNLIEQFRQRKIKKEYLAICWGNIKKDKLVIDLPLTRDTRNRLKMKISFVKSKHAKTTVFVLERFSDSILLKLEPFTGRMHQIRVHLKFLGLPIVGDKKYGIKDGYKDLFLHAHRLGLYHPVKRDFMEFESIVPERFKEFIEARKCIR